MSARGAPYPPIGDYALISDCHSAALISHSGSIDWCCLPRFDSTSVFGRLLDWNVGGHCSIRPAEEGFETSRRYVEGTLVLETTFRSGGGDVRLLDCFTMRRGGAREPYRQLLRVVEGIRGRVDLGLVVSPRFDYGEIKPWIRQQGVRIYSAIGGNVGLLISADVDIESSGLHDLEAAFSVRAGERAHLSITFLRPEDLDPSGPDPPSPQELDDRLDVTIDLWRTWSSKGDIGGPDRTAALRSAIVLKGLTNAPTGAIAAAPTTSLPEVARGGRNWDYRYSWVRDSSFAIRSLTELGHDAEADGFRRFIERSAAGSADELQIVYGVGGERRLGEVMLGHLEGYRGATPVRAGNVAASQMQHDCYGHLLELAWRWHRRGHSPDDDYWRFLVELVEAAIVRWARPDSGIWEMRSRRRHFVHSKVMCWVAVNRGITLAKECLRKAPIRRWTAARAEIRKTVERRGYDRRRGVFVQAFDRKAMDAALLLLPAIGFVDYDDPRMLRTVDAIREDLSEDGVLLRRHDTDDGLPGREGAFLPCSFWLAECLARQGRLEEAREVFDRASATGNDLGLFSEEFDVRKGEMLGNFPQGLTHLSHIAAVIALRQAEEATAP